MRERNKMKELLSKKDLELEDLENSQPSHTAKNDKAYSEKNTKGVAKLLFDKEINMGVSHKFNQPPQLKPGIKTG